MYFTRIKKIAISSLLLLLVFTTRAQTYVMGNLGSISTCSGNFYASGGQGGSYGNDESYVVTFCSSSAQALYFQFSQFQTETGFDTLYVFDGNSTSAPLIGAFSGTASPGTIVSTNGSNCLTFYFKSDLSVVYSGWEATIGCGTPPPPPPPASGTACSVSQPFCSGTAYTFPAATNTTAEVGPDYGCVFTQPNPVWYYLQIDNPGNLDITLSNTANTDVDFVCWGPFSTSASCGSLTAGNIVDCSYSTAATEYINIAGATHGQYYILCITNFSNSVTNFTLSTDGTSTASTNCLILCNIAAMTAVPSACNPADNTHALSGTLSVQYPPTSGTLTISTSTGQSIVLNPPFSTSLNYSIPGINSNGGNISVTAQLSTDTSCHFTTSYTSPVACTCSVIASNNSAVCEGSSVSLTSTVTGTITTYQWSGPNGYTANTQNPVINGSIVAQTGIYTVTVTAGSCTATDTTLVDVQPSPTITTVVQNITCSGGNDGRIVITATAQPPINYIWSGTLSTSDTAANLAVGTYAVTVTGGANSCSATASYNITAPTAVVLASPVITNATCSTGGSITVTASGGTGNKTYSWSNGDSTNAITNLSAGAYDLTVLDQNGCSITATYNVSAAPNAIIFGAPVITDAKCNGSSTGSITAQASGGTGAINFVWSNTQTTNTISGLAANVYGVTASDANGCSASVSYVVGEPATLVLGAPVIVDATCSVGGSITVSTTGGTGTVAFAWSNLQTGATVNNLSAGTYKVIATDQNNCSVSASYIVNPDPNAIVLSAPTITDVSCFSGSDGAITVSATGGTGSNYNYTWSSNPIQTGANASNLTAGSITVVVTDANLCSTTQTYTVNEPTQLTTTLQPTDATCYQAPNGINVANPSGGTSPYTYLWSDASNQTTKTAAGLIAGAYSCTVTDAKGCTTSASDVVNEPADMVVNTSVTAVKCIGDKNGTISVTATGGTSPYNFSATLDGANFVFATNGVIQGLAIGTYTVIVSDNNGCTKTVLATVPNAVIDNFTTATDSTLCYGSDYNDGAAHINATTAQNGPYQFSIDNSIPQSSGDFFNLSAGTHTITATNANGCVSTVPVVVLEPLPIIVDVVPDTVVLPLGNGQQVLVTYLNATNVTYAWTPELGLSCTDCPNPLVSPFNQQDYVVTIIMINGSATCYGSATLHADVTDPLPVFIPNSFTPNGDGNNDLFQLYGLGIKSVDLKIFNRWGELVYQGNNQFDGWDGTYKGQLQLPQVFTYAVKIVFLDDKKLARKGTVTLVR